MFLLNLQNLKVLLKIVIWHEVMSATICGWADAELIQKLWKTYSLLDYITYSFVRLPAVLLLLITPFHYCTYYMTPDYLPVHTSTRHYHTGHCTSPSHVRSPRWDRDNLCFRKSCWGDTGNVPTNSFPRSPRPYIACYQLAQGKQPALQWCCYQPLAEYPDEDGCIPFPIQYQSLTDTVLGQNATYTGYGIDTTEAIFAEQQGREGDIPLYICPAISTLKMVAVSCAYPPVAVFMPLCWDQNSRSNIQEKR